MKKILPLTLFILIGGVLSAQVLLDVCGDATIQGKLDLRSSAFDGSIFIGTNAGLNDDGGNSNTFLGQDAGRSNTSGYSNTFLGRFAGANTTSGHSNTFLGRNAGGSNTTGIQNTFVGLHAGDSNTAGTSNTFLGHQAGFANSTGDSNTFLGKDAGKANTTASFNTFLGRLAGVFNTTGLDNTFVGESAGFANSTGDSNTFLGKDAGRNNSTGISNTFVGESAGRSNRANFNTFLGNDAGFTNTTGWGNVFIGYQAGVFNTTGFSNTFVGGVDAGRSNTTGFENTFLGKEAGRANTTGNSNTFLGLKAGSNNTTGFRNTFVGRSAGINNFSGDNLEAIGAFSSASFTSAENAFVIGSNGLITSSHSGVLGNVSAQKVVSYVNVSTASDGRMKKNIKEDVQGLAFIKQLRPVSYQVDALKLDRFLRKGMDTNKEKATAEERKAEADNQKIYDGYLKQKSKIKYTGFIAQEVEEAAKEVGFEFSGVVPPSHDKDHYSLRYAEFVVPLVKGMQEQQEQIEDQDAIIEKQQSEIDELKSELVQQATELKELKNLVSQLIKRENIQTVVVEIARLGQNMPNPFKASTRIPYAIPEGSNKANIKVHGINGQLIKTIPISTFGEGTIELQTTGLTNGQYTYTLEVDGRMVDTKRMSLVK